LCSYPHLGSNDNNCHQASASHCPPKHLIQPPSFLEAEIITAPLIIAVVAIDDTRSKQAKDILSTEAQQCDGGAIVGLKDAKERSQRL